jgi:hypothetical protein
VEEVAFCAWLEMDILARVIELSIDLHKLRLFPPSQRVFLLYYRCVSIAQAVIRRTRAPTFGSEGAAFRS